MISFWRVVQTYLGSKARVITAKLRGIGNEGDSDEQSETVDQCEVLQPLGLMSRPVVTATTEAVGIRLDDQVVALHVVDKALPALDVAVGETRLYGAGEPTARVKLKADGNIEADAKAAGTINLNSGTKGVARLDDTVGGGQLIGEAFLDGGTQRIRLKYTDKAGTTTVLISFHFDGGGSLIPGDTIVNTANILEKITSASTTVKAG